MIKPITTADTLPLRSSVLWPGALEHVHVPGDDLAYHFGAFPEGKSEPISIISVFLNDIPDGVPSDSAATVAPPSGTTARFRKFATAPEFQSRGIGSRLLSYAFEFAETQMKAKDIWCSARTSSLEWYRKRGLLPIGDKWMKGGHEYVKMKRTF